MSCSQQIPMQYKSLSQLSSKDRFSLVKVLFFFGFSVLVIFSFFSQQDIKMDFIGWTSGFIHPLTGWDHLITMLAVGIWAAQLRGHAIWMLPLAFVGVMSLGGLAGAAGLTIPSVEGLILLSCAVFSILIIRKARFSTQVNVMIVAFFAFFHGFAHGQEISTSASLISYTLGFMLATLLLHGAGIIVAKLVVLTFTCLVAIFFSSMAQANHAESVATSKTKNIAIIKDTGLSPLMTISQLDYGEIGHSLDEYQFSPNDISNDCLGIASKSDRKCMANKFPAKFDNSSLGSSVQHSFVAGNIQGLVLNHGAFHVQESLQPNYKLYNSAYIRVSNLDFKHQYPNINHTPGKNLLSNGVGLTSPPQYFVNLVVPRNTQFFRKSPVLSFEAFDLQMAFAKLSFGNSPVRTALNFFAKDCALFALYNAIETLSNSVDNGNITSLNLIPDRFFIQPNGLAVGIISNLELLPAYKKIIKIQSSVSSSAINFIKT